MIITIVSCVVVAVISVLVASVVSVNRYKKVSEATRRIESHDGDV